MKIGKFISLIKERPVLYDSFNPLYKNRKEKDMLWKEISAQMNIHCEVAKSRWKSLKDCYTKYLKSSMATGPASNLHYHNWQWAEKMEFMKPHLKFGLIMSNIELQHSQETDDFGAQSSSDAQGFSSSLEVQRTQETREIPERSATLDKFSDDLCEQISTATKRKYQLETSRTHERPKEKRRKRAHAVMVSSDINTSPNNYGIVQYLESKKRDNFSATELIFLGYAKTIKTFSIRRQSEIKLKIAKIMMEAEIANYEENMSQENMENLR